MRRWVLYAWILCANIYSYTALFAFFFLPVIYPIQCSQSRKEREIFWLRKKKMLCVILYFAYMLKSYNILEGMIIMSCHAGNQAKSKRDFASDNCVHRKKSKICHQIIMYRERRWNATIMKKLQGFWDENEIPTQTEYKKYNIILKNARMVKKRTYVFTTKANRLWAAVRRLRMDNNRLDKSQSQGVTLHYAHTHERIYINCTFLQYLWKIYFFCVRAYYSGRWKVELVDIFEISLEASFFLTTALFPATAMLPPPTQ